MPRSRLEVADVFRRHGAGWRLPWSIDVTKPATIDATGTAAGWSARPAALASALMRKTVGEPFEVYVNGKQVGQHKGG